MKKYLIIPFLLLVIACEQNNNDTPDKQIKPVELGSGGDLVVSASNQFGFDLFKEIAGEEPADKNLFISPTSISLALAMTWNGAANATADSMAAALRLPNLEQNEINAVYRDLMNGLKTIDDKVLLSIANSIWYREGFSVEDNFLTVNQDYYNARVEDLDFNNSSSVDIINNWVEDNTNGKITDLITQIDPSCVMFLINAIYFKGTWQVEFDKEKTQDMPFYLLNGSETTVPMMTMEDTLNCSSNDLFQAVELDYGQGNYSMIVVLPQSDKTTQDVINELTPENWDTWMNSFYKTDLTLYLPRFKFEYEIQLKPALTALGMEIAFTPFAADFSGINPNTDLYIDYVKHKSFIEVNEEGTEAAAATVVAINEYSAVPNTMMVNHPFLFAIREKSTGAIVFIGRVNDPQE